MNNKFSPLKLASSADDLQSNIVHSECLFQQTNQICSLANQNRNRIYNSWWARTHTRNSNTASVDSDASTIVKRIYLRLSVSVYTHLNLNVINSQRWKLLVKWKISYFSFLIFGCFFFSLSILVQLPSLAFSMWNQQQLVFLFLLSWKKTRSKNSKQTSENESREKINSKNKRQIK